MNIYETLTLTHLSFTGIAVISGIAAMVASPKGGKFHKKTGMVYFYSFVGIILTAASMIFIKYKDLFVGITIFNTYLLLMGFRAVRYKNRKAAWLDWFLLSIFFCGGLLLLLAAFKIGDYRWAIVRAFFAGLTFYLAFKDFRYLRHKILVKQSWLSEHMEKMLLTYVSLVSGVMLRVSDYLFSKEVKWTFWITPYIVSLPLIMYWISKYKAKKLTPRIKTVL
jgi:hypothetical protein